MTTRRLAIGALLLAMCFAGCSQAGEGGCEEVGCSHGVSLALPRLGGVSGELISVRVCAEDRCHAIERERGEAHEYGSEIAVPVFEEAGESVSVTVTVRAQSGRVLVSAQGAGRVEIVDPGNGCAPCRLVRVRYEGERLVPDVERG